MKKGKFEIVLCFYAVLAFILAFLRMQTPLFLLLGFVIIAEQDEWTVKQVLQAVLMSMVVSIVNNFEGILDVFTMIPFLGTGLNFAFNLIDAVVNIAVFVLILVGIINVSKEKDANIPLFHNFAEWAYGKIVKKVTYQQPMNNNMQFQGQAPMNNAGMNGQNPQYQQPANNMQFQGQAPMNNMQFQQPANNMQFQGQAPMNDASIQNPNTDMANDSTQNPNA